MKMLISKISSILWGLRQRVIGIIMKTVSNTKLSFNVNILRFSTFLSFKIKLNLFWILNWEHKW